MLWIYSKYKIQIQTIPLLLSSQIFNTDKKQTKREQKTDDQSGW